MTCRVTSAFCADARPTEHGCPAQTAGSGWVRRADMAGPDLPRPREPFTAAHLQRWPMGAERTELLDGQLYWLCSTAAPGWAPGRRHPVARPEPGRGRADLGRGNCHRRCARGSTSARGPLIRNQEPQAGRVPLPPVSILLISLECPPPLTLAFPHSRRAETSRSAAVAALEVLSASLRARADSP
jgi:hypothetical protein